MDVCRSNSLPAFSRATGIATAGPIPITSGAQPFTANERRMPRIGRHLRCASCRVINNTAAAPSLT